MASETDSAVDAQAAPPSKANIPEFSVSELSAALKRTVERDFSFVRIRGEVSGFRGAHASGHAYFALKENDTKIDAVCFRNVFQKVRSKLSEGMEVIATGRVTTFPGKSSYQIIIENIEPAGLGALMQLLEERRKKLAAEGLFDEALKKPLPYLPTVIGVVTSPTGAVIRDILHRLSDRFPRHVLVWPVSVQGEKSSAEVSAAIAGLNALDANGPIPRPDVIIVARGGGSIEDLWPFNEEIVVRAVYASLIPVISAVGHETDTTLIDFAADLRAPRFTITTVQALARRLRRTYFSIYLILLLAWVTKGSVIGPETADLFSRYAVGWIPGLAIVIAVAAFFAAMIFVMIAHRELPGELAFGDVHM